MRFRRDYMDIAAMSMALSQSKVQQQASLALMKKTMNVTEANASDLIQMLSQSVAHPHLGGKVDIKG